MKKQTGFIHHDLLRWMLIGLSVLATSVVWVVVLVLTH